MASFTKRNGRWFAQVLRKGFPSQSRTFSTLGDAKKWAATQEAPAGRPCRLGSADVAVTFGDVLDRYEKEVTPTKRSAFSESMRLRQFRRDRIGS